MITLRKVTLQRGAKRLLEDVDLTILPRQKIGVTGANGSGKSSLLALLRGQLHAEAGDVDIQPGLRMAHVAQETPSSPARAIEYVLDGHVELRRVECALRQAEHARDHERAAALHAEYEQLDGYSARARAARILSGLGFGNAELERPVAEFSGGWRMRLNLAQALLRPSDVLLLDEPTNHLDLDAVFWLEDWLRRYDGTVLLISHDREFLDATVDSVCHLEAQSLRLYKGNYSDFERQRAAFLAGQQAMHEKQQRQIAHLRSFVERFRAKATKARQAQSRLKMLDRMDTVAAVHVATPFTFSFRAPRPASNVLLTLDRAVVGYGDTAVIDAVEITLLQGARIGLLGANGAGKSTLMKMLAGEIAPLHGQRREGKGLAIGYFAQHQLEQLRADETPLQHLMRLDRAAREQDLRDYLGGFDFRGGVADAPVGRFSGGERARLTLALLIWRRPNLLLLDEPTNHLDLEMREALSLALQDYEGAMVVVSHDRHLLRTCADELMLVDGGRLTQFDGDLDDYREWLARRRREQDQPEEEGSGPVALSRREQRRQEAEARNRAAGQRRPLEQALRALDKELLALGQRKAALESRLAEPDIYAPDKRDALKAALLEQSQVNARLTQAEDRWLELQGQLESL
ncbi:MAG: ATP-binding cassette domain-containing protein [Burkholderiales bacterium]|nr:ATP-binding cassette domain-containing protein [Burkholderiales bacterium]